MKPGTRYLPMLLTLCAISMSLPFLFDQANGQEPKPKAAAPAADAQPPWGKEVDGLAMRLVVSKEAVPGASILMVIEIKNVSDRQRYIVDPGRVINPNYMVNTECSSLTVSDLQGAPKAMGATDKCGAIPPTAINPIEPQEVKRVALDLNSLPFYSGVFKVPGEYRLKFTFASPEPARGVVGNKPGKPAPVKMPI